MKAIVLVLVLGLAAVLVPGSADAHIQTCYADDARCVAECLAHQILVPGDHICAFRPRP